MSQGGSFLLLLAASCFVLVSSAAAFVSPASTSSVIKHRLVAASQRSCETGSQLALRSFIATNAEAMCRFKRHAHANHNIHNKNIHSLQCSSTDSGDEFQIVVAMIGASGSVGRLTAAYVNDFGVNVRAIVRNVEKGKKLLNDENIEVVKADVRNTEALENALKGCDAVIITTGAPEFPNEQWLSGNTPQAVDDQGVRNIVAAIESINKGATEDEKLIKKVTLLSSMNLRRAETLPSLKMRNVFGALDAKLAGEQAVIDGAERAAYSYAVVRPAKLIGGPYTSPDIRELLRPEVGERLRVVLSKGDPEGFAGECSRRCVAMVLAQTLLQPIGDVELSVKLVDGEELDQNEWDKEFAKLMRPAESMRLEFDSLDVFKLQRWLVDWANGIMTSDPFFPPLPTSLRVDFPEKSSGEIGVYIMLVSVTNDGRVEEKGALHVRLVEGDDYPYALVATREPAQDSFFPGERQILTRLQEDLSMVSTSN